MAKRLSAKHRLRERDQARDYREGKAPAKHKVAVERSKKALKKNAFRAV
jgi:hypothetical protein